MKYAERYYVQYPSLTIGIYPPVFYAFEAFFFKFLGISSTVARLSVLFFTLLGVNIFFMLCRLWYPLWLSAVGSILCLLQPSTLFGQKNVMLEMPFLATSMIALYCLYVATERDNRWALCLAPLFTAIAFLTRQSAIFLIPVWLGWIIFTRKWRLFKSVPFIVGVLTGTVILIPWVIINATIGSGHVGHLNLDSSHIWPNCLYYLRVLPQISSYPVILLSIASFILFVKLRKHNGYKFAILWGCSVILTLLPMKLADPRYAIGLIPAMIILSIQVISLFGERYTLYFQRRSVPLVLTMVLLCLHIFPGEAWDSPDIKGFDRAADFVVRDTDCVSVLYDGYFNGNFILHMRMRDKDRRVFVFRASKVIFSTMFQIEFGYNELVRQTSEFYEMLDRYSIKYVVQEEKDLMNTPANKRLRNWLQGPGFTLVREFSVPHRGLKGFGSLLVYEYIDYEAKPLTQIDLDMPTMGGKISVKLQRKK